MYQIFVVEDELLIRQSIRNVIEKMPGPYVLCGEASDGEMALCDKIPYRKLQPDQFCVDRYSLWFVSLFLCFLFVFSYKFFSLLRIVLEKTSISKLCAHSYAASKEYFTGLG